VHVSTHRLFYIDSSHPHSRSFALDLSHVHRTDYWAGLLRSSAKVTLYLNVLPPRLAAPEQPNRTDSLRNVTDGFDLWECEVCSYRNPPGLSPTASLVCGLCGVPRTAVPTVQESSAIQTQSKGLSETASTNLSSSLPSSSQHLPLQLSSGPPSRAEPTEVACPACTFLNHPSLPACEICGTALPRLQRPAAKSAPPSRPASDDEEDDETEEAPRMIKISFRKGGDKAFYAALRRTLLDKVWEVSGSGRLLSASCFRTFSRLWVGNNDRQVQVLINICAGTEDSSSAGTDISCGVTVCNPEHSASLRHS
jgi:ESCRT-II complex subunit VPS36